MDDLFFDVRTAFRALVRRPAFALMVVTTLGVGLGTSTAMFGVVHGVLLEPLPYPESDRLVTLLRHYSRTGREPTNMSLPDLRDVQERVSTLAAVAGYQSMRTAFVVDGEPRLLSLGRVSNGLLEVFRMRPHLGRDLTAADAEPNAPKTIVISHAAWQELFGGAPDVLGRVLELAGEAHAVVGVGPSGFAFPEAVDGWVAWQIDVEGCGRDCHLMPTVGRLADDADVASLGTELASLSTALEAEYPSENHDKRLIVRSLLDQAVGPVRANLWMLLGAVQLVVLIAAANVANLVLARGSGRGRELAIRAAVGADRSRLFRQLMLENAMLAAGGAVLGALIGRAVLALLASQASGVIPRLASLDLDGTVLVFTALVSLAVLMLFGLWPAMRLATQELRIRGKAGAGAGRRSRFGLLTAEVALALLLLLGAGLLVRSVAEIARIDLGFDPEHVTRFNLVLPEAAFGETARIVQVTEELEQALEAIPGVESAGMALGGPFGRNRITSSISPLDRPEPEPGAALRATFDIVTPGFFETLAIRTLQGRTFDETDTLASGPTAVVSRALADRYFPDREAVGAQTRIGVGFGDDDEDPTYTIIGVVDDVRAYSLLDEPMPAVYLAQSQVGMDYLGMMIRAQPGVEVLGAVRERVRAILPGVPIRDVDTQEEGVAQAYGPQRFYLGLLTGFAAVALALSAIGLYSVVTFLVAQRSHEMAVRMALGADASRILRLVVGDALRPAVMGVAIGLVGAWFAARALEQLLYGVSAHDAATYVAAPTLLLAVAALASLIPALRVARLEPRSALEGE